MFDIAFTGPYFLNGDPKKYEEISRFLLACLSEREASNEENCTEICNALVTLSYAPPAYDLGHYWSYAQLAGALAVCKNTETIWSRVEQDTKDRLDLVMELFVYLGAYATQRNNNYHTGFAWRGDYAKHWNPNFRLSVYPLMVYAIWYFEGNLLPEKIGEVQKIHDLLINFDFDAVMNRAKAFGFSAVVECWNKKPCTLPNGQLAPTAKELLENGGMAFVLDNQDNPMYAGSGETIKQKYNFWKGGLWHLPRVVLENCYSGGPCASKVDVDGDGTFDAYVINNTESAVEGQDGMFLELNSPGGTSGLSKLRSSVIYSAIDFELATALMVITTASGWWNIPKNEELFNKIRNGNIDLFHKIENGYHDVANGIRRIVTEETTNRRQPTFQLWKEYWMSHFE